MREQLTPPRTQRQTGSTRLFNAVTGRQPEQALKPTADHVGQRASKLVGYRTGRTAAGARDATSGRLDPNRAGDVRRAMESDASGRPLRSLPARRFASVHTAEAVVQQGIQINRFLAHDHFAARRLAPPDQRRANARRRGNWTLRRWPRPRAADDSSSSGRDDGGCRAWMMTSCSVVGMADSKTNHDRSRRSRRRGVVERNFMMLQWPG